MLKLSKAVRGCMYWLLSKTQQSIATTTSEAEYGAMAQGLKEMVFIRSMYICLELCASGP